MKKPHKGRKIYSSSQKSFRIAGIFPTQAEAYGYRNEIIFENQYKCAATITLLGRLYSWRVAITEGYLADERS